MSCKKVLILDYHLGNLFSVKQACDHVGIHADITSDKNLIEKADAFILPGVGAFIEAMKNLEHLDLIAPLKDAVKAGKPLFGICLGQQLLFTESEEFGARKGLDFISGSIRKFSKGNQAGERIKVPQIGWNKIYKGQNDWLNTPLQDIEEDDYMYFVHSYFVQADNKENILSLTNYEGIEYCSGVIKSNKIVATQFHPEKSGAKGLSIYKNWALQHNLI
ncbi:MAG: imidazole glycerol phosphate synthase subunit HisH [Bacteroidetes bacterium]|nr:imidazole glycerol phosphate synthase subunit HisH [Bacteroidota bacterium]